MPQGDQLRARWAENIQRTYYVDAVAGLDTYTEAQARDNSAQPWKTIQYAVSNFVWPTSGDVLIAVRNGTYQGATDTRNTVLIQSRGTSATKHLILRPQAGHAPVVKLPGGTGGTGDNIHRTGFRIFDSYVKVEGFEVTFSTTSGTGPSNGKIDGFRIEGPSATEYQIIRNHIHNIKGTGSLTCMSQGLFSSQANGHIYANHIHHIGGPGIDQQEHGIYLAKADNTVANNLIDDMPNGYGVQVYDGGVAVNGNHIVHNTINALTRKSCITVPGHGSNQKIKNNILTNSVEWGIEFYPVTETGSGNTIDYNVYFGHTFANKSHASRAGWTITNETTANPLYVNASIDDYKLQSSSPAISYTDTTFSPSTDRANLVRTAGQEDAGAHEYGATGQPVVPSVEHYVRIAGAWVPVV